MRTFIVRIHEDAAAAMTPPEVLRGVIDEVATGQRMAFRSADELISVLATAVRAPGDPRPAGQQEAQ
jgi:hypothetical protein